MCGVQFNGNLSTRVGGIALGFSNCQEVQHDIHHTNHFLHGQDMPRFNTRKKLNKDLTAGQHVFGIFGLSLCFFMFLYCYVFSPFIHLPPAASALGWAWPPKFRHAAAGRICSSRRAQLHPWRRVAVRRRFENGGSLGSSEMAGHGVHLRLGRLGHGLMCRIHVGTWIGQIQSAPTT